MAKKKQFKDPLKDVDPIMEQAFSSTDSNAPQPTVAQIQFPSLAEEPESGKAIAADIFSNIPVNVAVELGRAQVSLKEIYELNEGAIIELERLAGEPLDLVVNGQVIAHGEVVAIDNNYGLRLTEIINKAS